MEKQLSDEQTVPLGRKPREEAGGAREWLKGTMEGDSSSGGGQRCGSVVRGAGGGGGWKRPKIARSHVCCALGEL